MAAPELGFVRIIFARWLVLLPSGWSKHWGEADWGDWREFSQVSMIFGFLYSSVWSCSLGFVADGKKISAYIFVCSPSFVWWWCGGGGGDGGVPKKIAARWNKGRKAIIGNLLHYSATSMKRGNCWGWQKPTNLVGEGHEKEKWLTEICWRLHI